MGKIIINADIGDYAAQLHTPLDARKARQRRQTLLNRHPHMARRQQCRNGIAAVMRAGKLPARLTDVPIALHQSQRTRGIIAGHAPAGRIVETRNRRPATARQHAVNARFKRIGNDQPVAGQCTHQVMELRFNSRQIGKNIGMIEFKVIQYHGTRPIVDKLRAFIAKRRVVLVRLNNEKRRIGKPAVDFSGDARRHAKVYRHTANQKPWMQAGVLKNPGQHRRSRRFTMRTRHGERPASLQQMVGKPLRAGNVGQRAIENLFQERIAARNRIADDENIGRKLRLFRFEPFD